MEPHSDSLSVEEVKYAKLKEIFEDETLSHAARTFCARLILLHSPDAQFSKPSRQLAEETFIASGHVKNILQEMQKHEEYLHIEQTGISTRTTTHIHLLPPKLITSASFRLPSHWRLTQTRNGVWRVAIENGEEEMQPAL